MANPHVALGDSSTRQAFLIEVKGVKNVEGQIVSMKEPPSISDPVRLAAMSLSGQMLSRKRRRAAAGDEQSSCYLRGRSRGALGESQSKMDGHGDASNKSSDQVPVGAKSQIVAPCPDTKDPPQGL